MVDLDRIIGNFDIHTDWVEKYRYLIDLGRTLPPMSEELKIPENLMTGCISSVWMVIDEEKSKDGKFYFLADSDAHIVKGLIAILFSAYVGKTPEEISKINIVGIFEQLGLDSHLTVNRRSGFVAMVNTLKSLAKVDG